MAHCEVSASIHRYHLRMDSENAVYDWVEDGEVEIRNCDRCNLFFSTFSRAPASRCGRCSDRAGYPWINGKRAKWTGGIIMDERNLPEPDYGDDY